MRFNLPVSLTVLQVLPALDSGGVEVGTLSVAQAIVQAGHTAIVASAGGKMVSALRALGAHHIQLPLKTKNPLNILHNAIKLSEIIRSYKVNVVHARSRAPAWSSFLACKRTHCSFVTTVHGAYKTQNKIKKFYNSVMLRGDYVIAISESIKRYIHDHYPIASFEKICVIPRGIDCTIFDPQNVSQTRAQALAQQWNLPHNTPLMIMPARFSPTKGHSVLLKALSFLKDENFLCLLIGSDQGRVSYTTFLKKEIADLNLQNKVRLVEHCNDMPCAYKIADIVLNPSIVPEAFGRVIIEAQAMGKPIIATNLGAPIDLITHQKTGWLFPVGDSHALAVTIKNVLYLERKSRDTLARVAREHVKQYYSNQLMCQRTLELYQKVISEIQS